MADFTPPPAEIKDWQDRSESLATPIDAASMQDLEARRAADARAVAAAAVEHIEGQLPELISGAVTEAVIDGAEEAVDDAVAGLSLVKTTDAGAPVVDLTGDARYFEAVIDPKGRLSEATKVDGTKYLPRAEITSLNGGTPALRADPGMATDGNLAAPESISPMMEATVDASGRLSHGVRADGTPVFPRADIAGARFGEMPVGGQGSGTVDASGRMAEDFIDDRGEKPAWILSRWFRRAGIFAPLLNGAVPPLVIIEAGGQSNSTSADVLPADVQDEDVDQFIYRWSNTAGAWVPAPSDGFSERISMAVAREYVRKYLPPGMAVGIVDHGVGSSGHSTTNITPVPAGAPSYMVYGGAPNVGTWDRTITSDISSVNLYNDMIARSQAAYAAAPAGSRREMLLWSGHEADTGSTGITSIWKDKMVDLFNAFKAAVGAPANYRIVMGGLSRTWTDQFAAGSGVQAMVSNLQDMPRLYERLAYAPGPDNYPDVPGTSGIHWTSQGQRARGPVLLDGYRRARTNVASVDPMPPHTPSARRSGQDVRVKWDHPETRVSTFELQKRIDGGAWTDVPLPSTLTYEITLAGAVTPTQSISFRMRTTNAVGTSLYSLEFFA